VRSLNRRNVIARTLSRRCRTIGGVIVVALATVRQSHRSGRGYLSTRIIRCHSESVHLGEGKKALSVNEEIVLAKAWRRRQGRRRVSHNLEHVISSHCPAEIEDVTATTRIMDFLAVRQDQAFSGSDTPYQRNVVLSATTGCARFSSRQGLRVAKTKTPKLYKRRMKQWNGLEGAIIM